jgi:acyl carrier protein
VTSFDNKFKALIRAVADVSGVDEVHPDTSLAELGVNSMMVVEIIIACEQIYTCKLDDLQIDQFTTIQNLHDQLVTLSSTDDNSSLRETLDEKSYP